MKKPTAKKKSKKEEVPESVTAGREIMCETRKRMVVKGLHLDYFLDRIKYLCEATKPISCIKGREADGGTVDFVDVPDNQAIAKGVDIGLSLGDYYPDKKIKADIKLKGDLKISIIDRFGADHKPKATKKTQPGQS